MYRQRAGGLHRFKGTENACVRSALTAANGTTCAELKPVRLLPQELCRKAAWCDVVQLAPMRLNFTSPQATGTIENGTIWRQHVQLRVVLRLGRWAGSAHPHGDERPRMPQLGDARVFSRLDCDTDHRNVGAQCLSVLELDDGERDQSAERFGVRMVDRERQLQRLQRSRIGALLCHERQSGNPVTVSAPNGCSSTGTTIVPITPTGCVLCEGSGVHPSRRAMA